MENFILSKLKSDLPSNLFYHGLHHTIDVFNAALQIGEQEMLDELDSLLLKTAALFHDSGFMIQNKGHELIGCEMARNSLPDFGYSENEIEIICGMIMATKVPQSPKCKLEEIICDADLDYLGRDDYDVISNDLYQEINQDGKINKKQWLKLQIDFLENHRYFTQTSIKNRNKNKAIRLIELKKEFNN